MKDHPRHTSRTFSIACLLSATTLFTLACQRNQSPSNISTASPNQTVATAPSPSTQPEVKIYHGVGIVTKIVLENPYDKTQSSVELDHEEIVGLMPPMRMEFNVKEKSLLTKLKVRDKVEFTIEEKGGMEIISEIKKQ